jgi:enamine deaminase RidA (YjgF/YER057c/UK114 family)
MVEGVTSRSFAMAGGSAEHFILAQGPAGLDLNEQVQVIQARYREAQQALDLTTESAIFRRIFVSDAMNQARVLRESPLAGGTEDDCVAVSIVQQPPLPDARIALLAYHVQGGRTITKRRLSPKHVLVEKGRFAHLWSTRLCSGADCLPVSASAQTREVFGSLVDVLGGQGGILRDNCVRTWIYLKDVDVFYQGMVEGRTSLFQRQGLTADTHYIASTGIQGACAHRYDLVQLDAYSILGLCPEQVTYLNDLSRLCPTKAYGVTFERGTRIAYADRSHYFISGTASIDETGEVAHPGDVLRQLDRALGNVDALLRSGSASLADMMYLIVYLRDPADYSRVNAHLSACVAGLPTLILHAPVCRPQWLVEVEGVAIGRSTRPALPAF